MPRLRALGWGRCRARGWHVWSQPQPCFGAAGGFLVTFDTGRSKPFQPGFGRTLLIYCSIWMSWLDTCHCVTSTSHVSPPGSHIRKIIQCLIKLGNTGKACLPKYPHPAANVPREPWEQEVLGPPCPLRWPSPSPWWGWTAGGHAATADALGGADAVCLRVPRPERTRDPDAAVWRSVEADGALPPFSAFSWGCKMGGGSCQLCLISGIILGPSGNRDSLHPTSELTWQMGKIHAPGFTTDLESKTCRRPSSDDQCFFSAGKSILIHSDQS